MTNEESAAKLAEVEQRGKSNTHQIEDVKKRQDNLDALVQSVAELSTEQRYIKEDVVEIKDSVKALTAVPAKRWDGLVDKLLFGAAGAFIAWIAAGMPGMK